MSYTALTDPFIIHFTHDGLSYEAEITYVKSNDSFSNFFDVAILKPEKLEPFYLKEKPTLNADYDNMVWVDEHEKLKMLYQLIGNEIEKHLRKNLGIFLIDSPLHNREEDFMIPKGNQ